MDDFSPHRLHSYSSSRHSAPQCHLGHPTPPHPIKSRRRVHRPPILRNDSQHSSSEHLTWVKSCGRRQLLEEFQTNEAHQVKTIISANLAAEAISSSEQYIVEMRSSENGKKAAVADTCSGMEKAGSLCSITFDDNANNVSFSPSQVWKFIINCVNLYYNNWIIHSERHCVTINPHACINESWRCAIVSFPCSVLTMAQLHIINDHKK